MRRHDDPIVECPFDKNHKMPHMRLTWHLAKCKSKKDHIQKGLPIYHCQYNYSHTYIDKTVFDAHEEQCPNKQKITEQLEVEQIHKLNRSEMCMATSGDLCSDDENDVAVNQEVESTTPETPPSDQVDSNFESVKVISFAEEVDKHERVQEQLDQRVTIAILFWLLVVLICMLEFSWRLTSGMDLNEG